MAAIFKAVCGEPVPDDGLSFDADSVKAESARDEEEYTGVRITLVATLAGAKLPIQIDIGFGDAVTPGASHIFVRHPAHDEGFGNVPKYNLATGYGGGDSLFGGNGADWLDGGRILRPADARVTARHHAPAARCPRQEDPQAHRTRCEQAVHQHRGGGQGHSFLSNQHVTLGLEEMFGTQWLEAAL